MKRLVGHSNPAEFTLRRTALLAAFLVLAATAGCEKTKSEPGDSAAAPPPATGQSPHGEAPRGPMMGTGMTDAEGPTDNHEIALKASGLNSAEEMNRALGGLSDSELRSDFETAFRSSFSAKQAQRNYPLAVEAAERVVAGNPGFAPGYRVLGYAYFNTGRQSQALTAYRKSVEIDPGYGEAHYALAFMYAMGDLASGREHFRKAMELGIPDERDLGNRFYSGAQ